MSLEEEYGEKVSELERSVDRELRRTAVRVKSSLDSVMPFIGLLVLFIVLFGFVLEVNRQVAVYVTYANYAVVGYFGLRLAAEYKLRSADQSLQSFFQNHWLDVAMVVPAFSLLDEAKLAQMAERSMLARMGPEATGLSIQGTSVAAKLTRISRLIKRSVGF